MTRTSASCLGVACHGRTSSEATTSEARLPSDCDSPLKRMVAKYQFTSTAKGAALVAAAVVGAVVMAGVGRVVGPESGVPR